MGPIPRREKIIGNLSVVIGIVSHILRLIGHMVAEKTTRLIQ